MEKNKTVLTELKEWINNPIIYSVNNDELVVDSKHITLELLNKKIQELISKERENIQEAFDQGEIMAGHNEWGSFREYKSKEDYFEKTYQE